ncbi:MAG: hypothetical protein EOO28_31320 [Comamonadaceae bacterium]|nr:MAG: hypothetical protein EOO28_31320 [Comamonadaceae bacterium]
MSKDLTISLDTNVSMFTMAVHPGYQYIGRIQRGMEVGALALTPEGDYVQVNGSIVTPLNASRISSSLRKLQGRYGPIAALKGPAAAAATAMAEFEMPAAAAPKAPVTVIVKKKRIPVMPA